MKQKLISERLRDRALDPTLDVPTVLLLQEAARVLERCTEEATQLGEAKAIMFRLAQAFVTCAKSKS